jgi:hypothetical protein
MSRATDYQRKASERWTGLKAELEEHTFYLVQRLGPTVFSIRGESGGLVRVMLGNPHTCSCGAGPGQECIHTLFCLLKVSQTGKLQAGRQCIRKIQLQLYTDWSDLIYASNISNIMYAYSVDSNSSILYA